MLADIAEKVVELKAIKLMCVLLRRLEEKASVLLQSRTHLEQIQEEVLWLQNMLWYRKVRKMCPAR
jgi:hypothetical protein